MFGRVGVRGVCVVCNGEGGTAKRKGAGARRAACRAAPWRTHSTLMSLLIKLAPIVASLYLSKEPVTKRSTRELLPTPASPSNTTFTSRALPASMLVKQHKKPTARGSATRNRKAAQGARSRMRQEPGSRAQARRVCSPRPAILFFFSFFGRFFLFFRREVWRLQDLEPERQLNTPF